MNCAIMVIVERREGSSLILLPTQSLSGGNVAYKNKEEGRIKNRERMAQRRATDPQKQMSARTKPETRSTQKTQNTARKQIERTL